MGTTLDRVFVTHPDLTPVLVLVHTLTSTGLQLRDHLLAENVISEDTAEQTFRILQVSTADLDLDPGHVSETFRILQVSTADLDLDPGHVSEICQPSLHFYYWRSASVRHFSSLSFCPHLFPTPGGLSIFVPS